MKKIFRILILISAVYVFIVFTLWELVGFYGRQREYELKRTLFFAKKGLLARTKAMTRENECMKLVIATHKIKSVDTDSATALILNNAVRDYFMYQENEIQKLNATFDSCVTEIIDAKASAIRFNDHLDLSKTAFNVLTLNRSPL